MFWEKCSVSMISYQCDRYHYHIWHDGCSICLLTLPLPVLKLPSPVLFFASWGWGATVFERHTKKWSTPTRQKKVPYIQARINIFFGYSKQALPQQGNIARCDSLGCCRLPVFFHHESPESQTKCSYENLSLGLDKLSPIHSSGLLLLPSLSGDGVISRTSGEAELIEMLSYHPLCTVSRAPWKSVEETKFLLFPLLCCY